MASKTNEEITDLSVCSICFKKYRTPRILPCSHVFCHECISSTIVSTCQSKEAPVGFSCPLCREFVPSSAAENSPEKWADNLLECKILDKLNKEETNLCAACLRENEEEEATDICITCDESLCGNCTKYHKRILTTRYHVVCSLTDPSLAKRFLNLSLKIAHCPAHPDKEIEVQCNDHKIVCCSLCASTEHRKCAEVTIVNSCVQKIKKGGDVQKLKQKIMDFEQALVKIKKKQEDNIVALDVASDRITDETTQIRKDINERLDKLEKEHLDEIGQMTKNSKIILNKTIDSLSDRIEFSKHCIKILEDIEGKTDSCFLKDYQITIDRFKALERQTIKLKEHEIKFESNLSPELSQVANLSKLSTNRVVHFQHDLASEKSESGAEDTVHVGNTSDSKLSEVAKIDKEQSLARIIPIIEPMSWEAVAAYTNTQNTLATGTIDRDTKHAVGIKSRGPTFSSFENNARKQSHVCNFEKIENKELMYALGNHVDMVETMECCKPENKGNDVVCKPTLVEVTASSKSEQRNKIIGRAMHKKSKSKRQHVSREFKGLENAYSYASSKGPDTKNAEFTV